jgi:hypothetical protein
MLALPLLRLADAEWPAAIDEYLLADGRLLLIDARTDYRGDGVPRSRPRNAARIALADGGTMLGYVVAVAHPDGSVSPPPEGIAWAPSSADCELVVRTPVGGERRIACASVTGVVRPNRMSTWARFRLSLGGFLPGLPIRP